MEVRRLKGGNSKLCVCWKSITALHLGTGRVGRASAAPYQLVVPLRLWVDSTAVCVCLCLCASLIERTVLNDDGLVDCKELGQGHDRFLWLRDGLIIQTAGVNPPSRFTVPCID